MTKTSILMRQARAAFGVSQARFAEILSESLGQDINRENVSAYENDKCRTPGDILLCAQELLAERQQNHADKAAAA